MGGSGQDTCRRVSKLECRQKQEYQEAASRTTRHNRRSFRKKIRYFALYWLLFISCSRTNIGSTKNSNNIDQLSEACATLFRPTLDSNPKC